MMIFFDADDEGVEPRYRTMALSLVWTRIAMGTRLQLVNMAGIGDNRGLTDWRIANQQEKAAAGIRPRPDDTTAANELGLTTR